MLNTETKRRIDTARDILVGKVPDPKSQVEQITIALIYKFMDDMDAESEEFGGKSNFFAGDFSRYGWAKLMRSGLGGHETLNLYAEAIARMPENPGVPLLFRDIFKNAYLPYRDPETLRMFLKIIDEFNYDHSEDLGDAFEYLLSVLGSQGDAGQFRTPRHIIDFIAEILDPKKNETVLDPACGTAGFLISSYKHIIKANRDSQGNSTLTPDEKNRLAQNFKGYDISPDMVRLSLVNMYLHGFADPHIYEYDTLSSQDRWNEYADIILANPPFMSPKGGIKPHNRFSVQSKRSEVLFVDYMAEHLTPNGRAGIIVPEGIIFQSQTAYTQLRKMLVNEYLVAVISLPAGVFNPYAGVKTSILILDKSLARKTGSIGFFKVENDGYGLGAQRREIDKNDLPEVLTEINEYLRRIRARETFEDYKPPHGLIVPKEKIAANGEYNLSGEIYRDAAARFMKFPWRRIESLVETITPPSKIQKTVFGITGRFPIIDQSQEDIAGWTDDESVLIHPNKPLVIFGDHTCAIKLVETPFAQGADGIKILQTIDALEPRFLFYILSARPLEISGYQRHFSKLKELQIPLPPLEVQKEIVVEIEGYQKVINGAHTVVKNYRPHIQINPEWPMIELGEICSLGGTITTAINFSLPYIGADSIESNTGKLIKTESAQGQQVNGPVYAFAGERLLYSKIRPYLNKLTIVNLNGYCSSDMYPLIPSGTKVNIQFLATYMLSDIFNESIRGYYERASIPKINRSQLFEVEIPLPPLAIQQAIVAEIEVEQKLVEANRELIKRLEKKIQDVLERVWGEEKA
jgi:type I restriction enzyme M protein